MMLGTGMRILLVLLALISSAAIDQCQPYAIKPWWPTYHIVGNATRNSQGELPAKPEHLNDANAIFQFKGKYHVMHQYHLTWGHLTSDDLVRWTRQRVVFASPPPNSTWDKEAECDGSLSFPAGIGPRIMWTPACDVDANDRAHLAVAEPADPEDPMLLDWIKDPRNPATGDIPSFPDSVWKSEVGDYYNMLGAFKGSRPWARYTSDLKLLKWKLADSAFATWKDNATAERCQKCCSFDRQLRRAAGGSSAPQFYAIPGAPPGGPTHIINAATGNAFALGVYDPQTEHMTISDCKTVAEGDAYKWTATGPADGGGADSTRLLSIAWLWPETYVLPKTSLCVDALSLVRELKWDTDSSTIIAKPAPEYALLRNAMLFLARSVTLSSSGSEALKLAGPAHAGSASEVLLTVPLSDAAVSVGIAVLVPPGPAEGAATVWLNVSSAETAGAGWQKRTPRAAVLTLINHHGPPVGSKTVSAMHHFEVHAHERSVDVQIFIDRVVIEAFAMDGRASVVGEEYPPNPDSTGIHLYNGGSAHALALENVTVYGMGCGWKDTSMSPSQTEILV